MFLLSCLLSLLLVLYCCQWLLPLTLWRQGSHLPVHPHGDPRGDPLPRAGNRGRQGPPNVTNTLCACTYILCGFIHCVYMCIYVYMCISLALSL